MSYKTVSSDCLWGGGDSILLEYVSFHEEINVTRARSSPLCCFLDYGLTPVLKVTESCLGYYTLTLHLEFHSLD